MQCFTTMRIIREDMIRHNITITTHTLLSKITIPSNYTNETMKAKKYLSVLMLTLLAVTIGSCKDSEEENVEKTPLLLLEKANTSPEDIRMVYYTPDPSCLPKTYCIYANLKGGELSIEPVNSATLSFGVISRIGDSNGVRVDDTKWVSRNGKWTATLTDGKTLKFAFDPVADASELGEYKADWAYIPIVGTVDGRSVTTELAILRHSLELESSEQ